jgi:hypothetical protein
MKNSKCFSGMHRLRMLWMTGILAAACGIGPALADDTKLDDSAKKVGNNFGELLKGMGQEVKKVTNSDKAAAKKDEKKEKKSPEIEPDKNKENPR